MVTEHSPIKISGPIDFSFILNSRGRKEGLRNLLESIKETADDISKVEICIRFDNDDIKSLSVITEPRIFPNIRYFVGPRPNSLNESNNFLAANTCGAYIGTVNDDLLMEDSNWDTLTLNKIQEYRNQNSIKDPILMVAWGDNSCDKPPGSKYPSFPVISRETVKILGKFMEEKMVGLGADNLLHRILSNPSVNRVVYIPEIVLNHHGHSSFFQVMTPDQTAKEMRQRSWSAGVDCATFPIEEDVKKLKEYIAQF